MLVALAYFVYLAIVGAVRKRPLAVAVAVMSATAIFGWGAPHIVPVLYLLVGYWLPALLVRHPHLGLERRLRAFDAELFGTGGPAAFARRVPRAILEYLEVAYLCCYVVVPAGWAWLALGGFAHEATAFWSTVLLASFTCYGLLPWLATRAPRAVEPPPADEPRLVRQLNLTVLDRASVKWNTFPSGHTAASLATALVVGAHIPLAGWVLGFIAVSIAVGSVVGRYHYAADAIVGALIAVAAFVTASAVRAL